MKCHSVRGNVGLQGVLYWDFTKKGSARRESALKTLSDTLSRDELIDGVIARVQRNAVAASGETVGCDFNRMGSYEADRIKESIPEELNWHSEVRAQAAAVGDVWICFQTVL